MPEQILYFHTYPELEFGSPTERIESLRGVHRAFCAEWRKGGLAAAEPHLILVPEPYRELSARELARRFLAANFPAVNVTFGKRDAVVGTYQLGPLRLAYLFLRTNLPSLHEPVWPQDAAGGSQGLWALPAPRELSSPNHVADAPEVVLARGKILSGTWARRLERVTGSNPRHGTRRVLRRRTALWAGASTAAAAVVLAAMRFPPPHPSPVTTPKRITRGEDTAAPSPHLPARPAFPITEARRPSPAGPAPRQPSVGELWASGAAHYHAGEFGEARRLWEKALRRDPLNPGLQESVRKAAAKLQP